MEESQMIEDPKTQNILCTKLSGGYEKCTERYRQIHKEEKDKIHWYTIIKPTTIGFQDMSTTGTSER